jgi:hypothetical protein
MPKCCQKFSWNASLNCTWELGCVSHSVQIPQISSQAFLIAYTKRMPISHLPVSIRDQAHEIISCTQHLPCFPSEQETFLLLSVAVFLACGNVDPHVNLEVPCLLCTLFKITAPISMTRSTSYLLTWRLRPICEMLALTQL